MPADPPKPPPLPLPASRLSRMTRLGGLATRIAGGVAAGGARELAQGRRPRWNDLLLTPANARRLADELSRMRGAAMKMGQLLSMDAGELLPPELAQILSRLRAEANPMPPQQLKTVLTAAWGPDWLRRFQRFEVRPLAAASIGQVHRALTRDGRDLAIKVQYPGVRRSIDSDVTNVGALLRLSGLVPRGLDLDALLAEARRQLHEEADYPREGACLRRFGALLEEAPDFRVPALAPDLTTDCVLAMSHEPGHPVEDLVTAPQEERDRVATLLLGLALRELFEFGLMQTDPNFANYRYQPETGRIVLLDFGATRSFPAPFRALCRDMLRAGQSGEREALRAAAQGFGLLEARTPPGLEKTLLDLLTLALSPLRTTGEFDFGSSDLAQRLNAAGLTLAEERAELPLPPVDALYVQRKFGGLYLLATRLRARVDLQALTAPYLTPPAPAEDRQ